MLEREWLPMENNYHRIQMKNWTKEVVLTAPVNSRSLFQVVHCSAGVGRTGTFIVVDAMLQSIAAEKTVDVFGYVMTLRRDRNIMVQVEEQYVFIHEVLLEAIHSGYTEIRANDLRSHMKLLMQVSPSTGTSFLHLVFKFVWLLHCQKGWEFVTEQYFCYRHAWKLKDS